MYKKGFTLIELLAVIVIMGIILAIAIPSIFIVIENSKEKAWKNQQKLILDAAEKYVGMNPDKVPQEFETIKIKLEDLISANLIDKDIKNPKTNEIVDPNREVVAVTNEGSNKIKYTFIEPNDDENPGGGEEIPGGGAILDIDGKKNTKIFVEGETSHDYLLQLQNGLDGGKIFNGEEYSKISFTSSSDWGLKILQTTKSFYLPKYYSTVTINYRTNASGDELQKAVVELNLPGTPPSGGGGGGGGGGGTPSMIYYYVNVVGVLIPDDIGEHSILLALIGFKQANTDLEIYLGDYQHPFNPDLKCFFYESYDSEEPVELIIDSVVIN